MATPSKDDPVSTAIADLSDDQRREIADKKATCPFIASVVESGELPVFNSADRPLAKIDNVAKLGDSGGGDLGGKVLKLFASGNHRRVPGPDGTFAARTPKGMFSLDFAGSQGAHPGHSGILLGDPAKLDAGRFSADHFERLKGHAENELLSTDQVGAFIAENIALDKASTVLPVPELARDVFDIADNVGDIVHDIGGALIARLRGEGNGGPDDNEARNDLVEKLTKFAGRDNLIGSAGEFGLMFALLANRPGAVNDAIRLADVEAMMVHHRLPDDWETWPKKTIDWVHATRKIAAAALKAHLKRP